MPLSIEWRLRALFTALLWVAMFTVCTLRPAEAAEPWTIDDTLAAVDGAPEPIGCIVYHETWPHWDPYSVGSAGELGPAQLHPRGELSSFLYGDWTPLPTEARDPFNPYQAVAFIEAYGMSHDWTFGPWSTWELCQ